MKKVTSTNYGRILDTLGYELFIHGKDAFGNYAKFVVSSKFGSGPRSCFDSMAQLRKYINQVCLNRDMEEMNDQEWNERNYMWSVSHGGMDYL